MRKKKKSMGITAIALTLLLSSTSFSSMAFASELENTQIKTVEDLNLEPGQVDMEKLPPEFRGKLEARIAEINDYLTKLDETKFSYSEQLKTISLNGSTEMRNTKLLEAKQEYDYLYDNAEKLVNITVLQGEKEDGIITPATTMEDVTVGKPTIWWDNIYRMNIMQGSWEWNSYTDTDPGGADGFGLKAVQRKISSFQSSLNTYNKSGSFTPHSYSQDVGNYGVGFMFQDTGSLPTTYSGYKGTGFLYFTWYSGTPVGYSVNYRSVYAHSYNTTSLNSFSIGADSFGISWSSTSNRFSKENYNVVTY